MSGSTFGQLFRVTTWGESHGAALGVVVDGCPAGLPLSNSDIQFYLNQRKPGQSVYTTPRKEDDQVEILSGVFEGKTTGAPISMVVYNKNAKSSDYTHIASNYRPGHADYTFDAKYGFRDYRGGGRSSARETIGRVAAGAIALKLLESLGITFCTYTKSIGSVSIDINEFNEDEILRNPVYMPDAKAALQAQELLKAAMADHDSVGGCVECVIHNVPAGLGEPVFDKLDARLSAAIMSIGAVKGFEIGDGFEVSKANGSKNNDAFTVDANGQVAKATNHAGGILGGISDGSTIVFRAAIKPTPSIFKPQSTINKNHEPVTIQIKGRHDPVIVPRAVVVVKSMAALTILDLLLMNMTATLEGVTQFYSPK